MLAVLALPALRLSAELASSRHREAHWMGASLCRVCVFDYKRETPRCDEAADDRHAHRSPSMVRCTDTTKRGGRALLALLSPTHAKECVPARRE